MNRAASGLLFALILISTGCTPTKTNNPTLIPGTLYFVPPAFQTTPTKPIETSTMSATVSATMPTTVEPENTPTPSEISPLAETTKPEATRKSTAVFRSPETSQPTATRSPTRTPTLGPDGWKKLPVIPSVDDEVLKIYERGLDMGNNPQAFSKIGDCGSTPSWFLGDFDRGLRYYRLGNYSDLAEVIEYYKGSFARTSLAARSGFNTSALFVPLWADRSYCESDESPLECEYRVHKPVVAFIMLGTNDVWHPTEFEPQMRKIIEFSINNGVIPILATKGDNQEGDGSINAKISSLAMEYHIPLWNYWRAISTLPDQGLQEDKVHLTWGPNYFDNRDAMSNAWPVRNLTALQVLQAVRAKINNIQY
jgi:hypothetical protein